MIAVNTLMIIVLLSFPFDLHPFHVFISLKYSYLYSNLLLLLYRTFLFLVILSFLFFSLFFFYFFVFPFLSSLFLSVSFFPFIDFSSIRAQEEIIHLNVPNVSSTSQKWTTTTTESNKLLELENAAKNIGITGHFISTSVIYHETFLFSFYYMFDKF